jgi:midasin
MTSCFVQDLDEEWRQLLCRPALVPNWSSLFQASLHPVLTHALELLNTPIDDHCSSHPHLTVVARLGHMFVDIFYAFTELYVPDTPLDPAATQQCEEEFWSAEETSALSQLKLHLELERLTTGNGTDEVVAYLEQEAAVARGHVEATSSHYRSAPRTVSRLREYWTEVTQFLSQAVPRTKVQELVALLETGVMFAATREHVVQESIRGFTQRMAVAYGDFEDITGPLHFALMQLRFGLRLLTHSQRRKDKMDIASFAQNLVLFPTIHAVGTLLTLPASETQKAGSSAFDHILLQLTGMAIEKDAGLRLESRTKLLATVFEQAVRLWSIERTRQEEEEKAGQSLYRSKQIESGTINDSELEAEEFLALFPDYDAMLVNDEQSTPSIARASPITTVSSQILLVHDMFLHTFTPAQIDHRFNSSVQCFAGLRKTLAQQLLDSSFTDLPETLDRQSFGFMLSMLHQRMRSFKDYTRSPNRPYDFYLDSNVPEVRKAVAVVEAMARRLAITIGEWPDQMVLQHLAARCEQVLRLSVHSPVAKVLSAIEQLLLQSEDWEMYANKENSLKDHRHTLTTLIVEWRKLELSSWQSLLETQAVAFEDSMAEWWFRIYDACVRGLLDVVYAEEDLDLFLDQLVPLIDDFISTAPIGQFSRRVQLLDSLSTWIESLISLQPPSEAIALHRVFQIVCTAASYYRQYLPRVSLSLASQREDLEKNVKDFIKLASWRDINVQALKASAKRTHVQLYKSIRKFREVLRQPAAPLLQAEHAISSSIPWDFAVPLMFAPVPPISFPSYTADVGGPAHLQDLPRTYQRFDWLIQSRVDAYFQLQPQLLLRDLADEILSTASELASISLPTGGSAERRKKYAKTLLVRKRKAWSDLLKELKRIGLAFNVKPEILERQQSKRWIREQPVLAAIDEMAPGVKALEGCFLKFVGLMPQLRSSLSSHHNDIATRELQRGVSLLESGLTFALDLRTR